MKSIWELFEEEEALRVADEAAISPEQRAQELARLEARISAMSDDEPEPEYDNEEDENEDEDEEENE